MARFQETKTRIDNRRAAADLVGSPVDPSDTHMLAGARIPKARKPYIITKQREKWSQDEHGLFLEALQLHGRSWRRIQEYIGTKTAVQIRSHAQKFFTKIIRESSEDNINTSGSAPPIQIPPARPKRKSVHPYPCNLRKASGKHVHALPQLEKPQLQTQFLREQENGSARSELSTSHMDSETIGSDDSDGSPASTIDVEERCPTPSMATTDLAVQMPPTNVKEANDDAASIEVGCDISEVKLFKLFGKVVNDSHQQPNSDSYNLQTVADMELDASAETLTSGTTKISSDGSAQANTWSPWPTNMQRFTYYLPPGTVFFSCAGGSMPCPRSSNQMAAASNQHQHHHHQHSEVVEHNLIQREASWAQSNTASCSVLETTAKNPGSSELHTQAEGMKDKTVPSGLRKSMIPTSNCQRGFMPYKRCSAETRVMQSLVPMEEADGEMTRLCL